MRAAVDALAVVQLVLFLILAAVASFRWFQRGGVARAWMAATFVDLGGVVLLGRFLSQTSHSAGADLQRKVVLAFLFLFPYFLYRFGATFRRPSKAMEVFAGALTLAAAGGGFLFRRVPIAGDPRPRSMAIYLVVVITQWTVLSIVVAAWLWAGGRGQPTVARRRMRTLSLGAIGLALAIVISGATPSNGGEPGVVQLVISLLVLSTVPLFLLGFSPPRVVLALWRRPEELQLRTAEAGLMAAMTPQEVADVLVPHVAHVMGAGGAVLLDGDGTVLAASGLDEEHVTVLAATNAVERTPGGVLAIPVGAGRIVVEASPYTPYFGREEEQILEQLGRLTDVALQRARLSERERQLADELRQANEAMREFVAIASHDLRTPITIVTGFASTTAHNYDALSDDAKRSNLEAIARQGEHLARLVDDLLTVSRIDADALGAVTEPLDVALVVAQVLGELGHNDDFATEVPVGLRVLADRDHLTRILRNYVENAVRYGAAPFTVRAEARDDLVELRVEDCGPGVPPEFEHRLFQRFARDEEARNRDKRGTGLGLSIVRGLAVASGGDAWYEPNQPRGSRFVVSLKRYDEGS
jgi:signal transduction histidine kinase